MVIRLFLMKLWNFEKNIFWIVSSLSPLKSRLGLGGEGEQPPPKDPMDLSHFLSYDQKIFFGRKHVYYVIGDKKKVGQLHIGRFYKRLKIGVAKKQRKNDLCLTQRPPAGNRQYGQEFFSGRVFMHFSGKIIIFSPKIENLFFFTLLVYFFKILAKNCIFEWILFDPTAIGREWSI